MDGSLIRVLVALLFAGLLSWQARRLQGRRNQRRAYELAALALLSVAGLNATLLAGASVGLLQLVMAGAAFLLLLAAAFYFLQAFRRGEMRPDVERSAEMAREFRERHDPPS